MKISDFITESWNYNFKIVPNSSKNSFEGLYGEKTYKIKVRWLPEKGRANKILLKFLSEELDIWVKNIIILNWETGILKNIKIIF